MIRRVLFTAVVFAVSFMLSGCKYALLNPKGVVAADEKYIMITAVLLMLIVVIPVIALTLFFAWRYRASNTQANYQPEWAHNTWIEIVCWTIPCIIIGILGLLTWVS